MISLFHELRTRDRKPEPPKTPLYDLLPHDFPDKEQREIEKVREILYKQQKQSDQIWSKIAGYYGL